VGIALLATAANAAPIMEYQADDLGGGLFRYTFLLKGNDDAFKSFATSSLTFTGNIQQQMAFFTIAVGDELNANTFDAMNGPAPLPDAFYDKGLDTWLYSGWDLIAPGDTDLGAAPGMPVVLSVGSGSTTFYKQKPLVQIVALGDVAFEGEIARGGHAYWIDGVASGDSGPNGETQADPLMPKNEHDPERVHNRWNNHGAHGEEAWNRWRFEGAQPGGDNGRWFDPPMVSAYLYETTDGTSTFAGVKLPVGIDSDGLFTVNDGTSTVVVPEGVIHPFGPGVDSFVVSGIDPEADSEDPLGFPTFLLFEETDGDGEVSFSMTGIPEPGTMGLILFGAAGMLARRRHQRN